MFSHRWFRLLFFICLLLTTACTDRDNSTAETPAAAAVTTPARATETNYTFNLPDDYQAETVVTGLNRPTQMIHGPDGRLWVAQLNGGESEGVGQIIAIDLNTGEREIILDGLLKPTGIAVINGYLWVALENSLGRAPLDDLFHAGELEIILDNMPYNGRSNGTLTGSPDNTLIYETSGRRRGNRPAEGSGTLWELDPATLESRPLASGLKGAYAHTFDASGRLWTTEIGDGTFNDGPPPGELNLVVEAADFGWPQCIGFQEPALNFEGTAEICAATRPPVALFPEHSTPTSIIPSPFKTDTFLVALWVTGEVWQVPVIFTADNAQGSPEPFITNLGNPQHLLATDDGTFLLSEYSSGTIYRISR